MRAAAQTGVRSRHRQAQRTLSLEQVEEDLRRAEDVAVDVVHRHRKFRMEQTPVVRLGSTLSLVRLFEPAPSTCDEGDRLVSNEASRRCVGAQAVVPAVTKAAQLLETVARAR